MQPVVCLFSFSALSYDEIIDLFWRTDTRSAKFESDAYAPEV